jgi:hypothetical protein
VAIRAGSLKCVIVLSQREGITELIEAELIEREDAADVRRLGDQVFLLHTEATAEAVRDRLKTLVSAGESVLAVEFERWSGHGEAVDRDWLRERGH